MGKVVHWFSIDSIGGWAAGFGGAIMGLAGGYDDLMRVLLIFMAVDFMTGVINAIRCKKLSSKCSFNGLLRKLTIIGVVVVAAQADIILKTNAACRTAAMLFYMANEGISIVENATAMGLPLPPKLIEVLGQLKAGGGKAPADESDDKNTTPPAAT